MNPSTVAQHEELRQAVARLSKARTANPSTVEFYHADGIVALATGLVRKSTNTKAGAMVQTYILRDDMPPKQAALTGADSKICGNCPLRPSQVPKGQPKCYVNTGWLTTLWKSWRKGNVPKATPTQLKAMIELSGRPLRIGAYGDPGFVPVEVWDAIAGRKGTGYTHQWQSTDPGLKAHAMASVQSIEGAMAAQAKGWRTYRVDLDGIGAMDGEIECPEASTNGEVQCADCGLIWEKRWHAETCGDDGRNHHASFAQGPYGVTYVLDGVPQGNIKYYTRFAIGRGKA